MYGYGYRYNSGLVVGAGGGGGGFTNTYSLDFDGVDDYVTMDSASSIFSSAYSVSFWFNGDSFPSGGPGGRILFSLHDALGGNLLLLYANTLGTLITYNNTATRTTGTTTTNTETWNNCIITSDGTNMKLYKNGTLEDTNSVGNFTTGTVGRVTLGQEWDGAIPSDFYNGKLDEVSFFNSEISASDVTTIFNSGVPTDLTSLAPSSWYRNGDNGSYKSPQWLIPSNENKDKVSNYSFVFDGVDDEVNCGNDSSLQNPNFTVSVWVYPTSTSGTNVIVQNTTGTFGTASYGFRIVRSFSNYIFYIGDGSGNNAVVIPSAATLNTWQNIIMTYDGTTAKYYLDGVLKTTSSVSNISYGVFPYNNFYIGTKGGAQRFNGNIDEVALWDSALTDISSIYNGGEPTTLPSGAVAHWRMGEDATFAGGVWTVPDSAGSNNGTSNAMTIDDRVGDAPNSTSNALSYNMDLVDRVEDTP